MNANAPSRRIETGAAVDGELRIALALRPNGIVTFARPPMIRCVRSPVVLIGPVAPPGGCSQQATSPVR
jgi:hypothetical protein